MESPEELVDDVRKRLWRIAGRREDVHGPGMTGTPRRAERPWAHNSVPDTLGGMYGVVVGDYRPLGGQREDVRWLAS